MEDLAKSTASSSSRNGTRKKFNLPGGPSYNSNGDSKHVQRSPIKNSGEQNTDSNKCLCLTYLGMVCVVPFLIWSIANYCTTANFCEEGNDAFEIQRDHLDPNHQKYKNQQEENHKRYTQQVETSEQEQKLRQKQLKDQMQHSQAQTTREQQLQIERSEQEQKLRQDQVEDQHNDQKQYSKVEAEYNKKLEQVQNLEMDFVERLMQTTQPNLDQLFEEFRNNIEIISISTSKDPRFDNKLKVEKEICLDDCKQVKDHYKKIVETMQNQEEAFHEQLMQTWNKQELDQFLELLKLKIGIVAKIPLALPSKDNYRKELLTQKIKNGQRQSLVDRLEAERQEILENCKKAKFKLLAKLYLKSWDARESERYLKDQRVQVLGDDQDQKFWKSYLNELWDVQQDGIQVYLKRDLYFTESRNLLSETAQNFEQQKFYRVEAKTTCEIQNRNEFYPLYQEDFVIKSESAIKIGSDGNESLIAEPMKFKVHINLIKEGTLVEANAVPIQKSRIVMLLKDLYFDRNQKLINAEEDLDDRELQKRQVYKVKQGVKGKQQLPFSRVERTDDISVQFQHNVWKKERGWFGGYQENLEFPNRKIDKSLTINERCLFWVPNIPSEPEA